jgi:hypothetical protein
MLQHQNKLVKKEVKWNMIAGIDKEELVLLKFTEEEKQTVLNWKHSREFEYRGEMYDIVTTERLGDTTYYWLWWDHEETKLNKQLSGLVAFALGHHPDHQEKQQRLNDFFKSLYFNDIIVINKTDIFQKKATNFADKLFYKSYLFQPPAPPPKMC